MRLAIIMRMRNDENDKPFNLSYYLDSYFKEIFDQLDITLIPVVSDKNLDEIEAICDGLVVTGSPNDIHPKYYQNEPIGDKKYTLDEYPMVKKVVELFANKDKPILGICAGLQEINVIFGGSLHQSIPNHNLRDGKKHLVKLNDKSFLYNVYKKNVIEVNSYHKQAINNVAPSFNVVALSEDGIIEGIERGNIIAVQWHPEALYDMTLFKSFIDLILEGNK